MIFYSSDSYALVPLGLPWPSPMNRWHGILISTIGMFNWMWVILFICQLSTSHWHASYLISSLHVGLDLFLSVALFLGLPIILTCQQSMGTSTLYSMVAICILILAQFLLALRHPFPLMLKLLVNLNLRIF